MAENKRLFGAGGRLVPVGQALNFTQPVRQQLSQCRFRIVADGQAAALVGSVFAKCSDYQMTRRPEVLPNSLGVVPGVGLLRQKMQRSPVVPEIVRLRRNKRSSISHNPVD